MKEIKAIIQPYMTDKVLDGLHRMKHFPGVTVFESRGQGRGQGEGGTFIFTEAEINFQKKVFLLIICIDEMAPEILATILKAAHTGNKGDGIVIVTDISEVIRIRTGERNEKAL